MLLPALALEYITGQPAEYSKSTHKYYRAKNVVAGEPGGIPGRLRARLQ